MYMMHWEPLVFHWDRKTTRFGQTTPFQSSHNNEELSFVPLLCCHLKTVDTDWKQVAKQVEEIENEYQNKYQLIQEVNYIDPNPLTDPIIGFDNCYLKPLLVLLLVLLLVFKCKYSFSFSFWRANTKENKR